MSAGTDAGLSLSQLDARSDTVAAALVDSGVRPGDPGVWPLTGRGSGRGHPGRARRRRVRPAGHEPSGGTADYYVTDSAVSVIVTDASTDGHPLWEATAGRARRLDLADLTAREAVAVLASGCGAADSLAYVIYTWVDGTTQGGRDHPSKRTDLCSAPRPTSTAVRRRVDDVPFVRIRLLGLGAVGAGDRWWPVRDRRPRHGARPSPPGRTRSRTTRDGTESDPVGLLPVHRRPQPPARADRPCDMWCSAVRRSVPSACGAGGNCSRATRPA